MVQKTTNIQHRHGATKALRHAIANLEQFSRKNESSPIVHVADLTVHDGALVEAPHAASEKTTSFVRWFLSALFSSKKRSRNLRKKEDVQHVVLGAIDVIKRNHLLIERFKKGTPEEQQLAASTLDVVRRYNAVLEQSDKIPEDWKSRISHFFSQYAGLAVDKELREQRIELPLSMLATAHAQEHPQHDVRKKISLAFQHCMTPKRPCDEQTGFTAVRLTDVIADPLSQQEADLLRMKAHTLLRQQGVRYHSMAEMLQEIKAAPIETVMDEATGIAQLSLRLTLLPGAIAEVHGAFQRSTYSSPIPGSFRLDIHSTQTAFPAPMQYSGWVLGDALIPDYPHRLDQMPLFKKLYARRQDAVMKLQPGEEWFEHARNLWKQKLAAFSRGHLALHKELNMAILHAASPEAVDVESEEVIEVFFNAVENNPSPAAYLTATAQTINENIITRPYALMQEFWLGAHDEDPKMARKDLLAALKVDWAHVQDMLDAELAAASNDFEKAALQYILVMGNVLHQPVQAILMQHFSETLRCAPPLLTDFEQRLQAAAHMQLIAFLDELDNPRLSVLGNDPKAMDTRMRQLLLADIALFQADSFDYLETPLRPLVDEFEVYFNSRHAAHT